MGRLIPAGTGSRQFNKMKVGMDQPEVPEGEIDEMDSDILIPADVDTGVFPGGVGKNGA